ncbi:MAG: ArsB/NhaD family transporter [Pseudomonadota bacterium]|nr:ArsB/NhaD family transporter [Gammaproteobacteria bacterium]MBU1732961.1 ArsB/NhaD family transporter [Gammaproteobacteria bacterium]MBU1892009.1 ArsB/NhaD family transporter [Gammaproteobacteria bacterium]
MHGMTPSATQVIFGLSPLLISVAVFAITYAIIITEKINRSIVALLGAGMMVFTGVLQQSEAFAGIDFNTLALLTGMMMLVAITQKSGVFQYVAIVAAKKVKADPWGLLVMLSIVTAVFSALLDNVTTVLLIAPVVLLITDALRINPYPYLFSIIFASNIGGTATLIGDPPNIMIGSAVGLTFNDFLFNLAPIAAVVFMLTLIPIYFIWGRTLHAAPEDREQVMAFDEREAITDVRLLKQSLFVLFLVILGFVFAHSIHQEPGTIAMFGGAMLLLLQALGKNPEEQAHETHKIYSEVEWITIFFFIGLFIVVAGIEKAGALDLLAKQLIELTDGDFNTTALTILWVSAIFSAIVDNIPFVATMIPVIQSMAPTFGAENLTTLWWSLALGACLGGNGSLVGASANLVVAGFAERAGQPIRFLPFMLMAFPLMLASIAVASIYLYLRYL